ncbi:hypothetical protein CHY_1759 [Carboxydothermus hydrogenoformans Z-2901]|uniref:Uncharacterized protein n=1 Tax=Carboxydothermus hydrogenoformans (strain ATCC BAA-161 / DSM 6008 / Z-2901) TaxID=246194 RepID=Q3ABA5_CARHZ|nr:hypothetical protein CHY_1759 [Carboxydothermus hydrogenoformans Z-2901]
MAGNTINNVEFFYNILRDFKEVICDIYDHGKADFRKRNNDCRKAVKAYRR